MRLASVKIRPDLDPVVVAQFPPAPQYVVDLRAAYARRLRDVAREPRGESAAHVAVPHSMTTLLERGRSGRAELDDALAHVVAVAAGEGVVTLLAAGVLHLVRDVQFLPPVPRPGKVIAVGANYADHVEEVAGIIDLSGLRFPMAFAKFPSVLVGHEHPIVYPPHTTELDYEAEVCVVVGRRCKDVAADDYLDVVAGFTIMNDVSMRDIQREEMERGLLSMGKNLDTMGPMGPWLVTPDEVDDPQALRITTRVDGEVRQAGSTADMIFGFGELVAYWSRMTLEPGDVISTGTPAGVGALRKNASASLLHPGQVVEIEVEGLGTLRNSVVGLR